jgi:ribosomal protein S2
MKIEKTNQMLYFSKKIRLAKLKKALNLIHKYNINNKRILFIGKFNKNLETVLLNTRHLCIPESVWVNGILTNPLACFKYLMKHKQSFDKKKKQNLASLTKKIDLIVIMNVNSNSSIFNESYSTQIPTILCDSGIIKQNVTYEISTNLRFKEKRNNNNFICSMILATIVRSNITNEKNKPKFYKIKKLF